MMAFYDTCDERDSSRHHDEKAAFNLGRDEPNP